MLVATNQKNKWIRKGPKRNKRILDSNGQEVEEHEASPSLQASGGREGNGWRCWGIMGMGGWWSQTRRGWGIGTCSIMQPGVSQSHAFSPRPALGRCCREL